MKLLAFLAGTAVAFPPTDVVIAKCETRCINAISPCGVPYGGCFNPCTEAAPVAPPCDGVTVGGLRAQGKPTNVMLDDCRTRTVCVDAVNECGIRYGGCIPDCRPWKLSKPPCPTATSTGTAFRESQVPRAVAYQTPS